MAGCGNKPEATAQKFLSAMEKRDFSGAKQYVTQDSQKIMDFLKVMFEKMAPEQREDTSHLKFKILNSTIQKDTATITYEETAVWDNGSSNAGNESPTTKELQMVKEDGKWKVQFKQ